MQSFTDATATPTPCYRLREIVFSFSFCFLFVDFLFVFGFFLFFGIALGMFDMISGIALVNLTKNEQKKMRKLSALLLLLSSVYSKDNLSASGTPCPRSPFSPREQCQSQTSERSINFWQTTRKWNRKRKQNNAKKKKRKEKITAQSGETRVSEIDGTVRGAGAGGCGKRGAWRRLCCFDCHGSHRSLVMANISHCAVLSSPSLSPHIPCSPSRLAVFILYNHRQHKITHTHTQTHSQQPQLL